MIKGAVKPVLLLAATMIGGGCVSSDMSDLENYTASVLARPGGQVEPLPPIRPYEPYIYQSADANRRDPFRSYIEAQRSQTEALADVADDEYDREIATHVKEELENYPLDALRMVGIMENNSELWGIVEDPTGTVHRVQVGNYMGTNFGKIMNIDESQIEMREIYQDPQGRWEERPASLALTE